MASLRQLFNNARLSSVIFGFHPGARSNTTPQTIPHARERTQIRGLNNLHARLRGLAFHCLFYGLRIFHCKTAQFCATRRESELLETPGVSDAAQAGENTRKNSFLN
jgi:hypothetical protein